ncbi:peptidase, M50 family [Dictyocaulus viviparus]|uniref:Membrane-bound transcription factor site-2 protease n=1 Tax=Dictyocaulus viviparus TaxID=29172 RepID=A0A0D8XC05_DICVI|nr:peptidase, M50 family [Dictyocaulus viviparus]
MLFTTALSYFLISWSSVFLLDYILRIKNFAPYVDFAYKYGLEVTPFQVCWCFRCTPKYLHFVNFSKLFACKTQNLAEFPSSPVEEYDILDGSTGSETGLVPIIPGVNLPWSHIPLFIVVLALAAIAHEMGHASAARIYNVRVNGFGVFLFGLYPGAFTDIDPESLRRSHPRHRLEIFSGGVWHNLVLAGVAYVIFLLTPYILSPLFSENHGVTVTGKCVDSRSGLYGMGGLSVGDVVFSIDDCIIRKYEDWRECVRHLEKVKHGVDSRSGLYGMGGLSVGDVVFSIDDCIIRKYEDWRECVRHLEKVKHGQCVPRSIIESSLATKTSLSLDELHCCDDFTNITYAHMCFESMLRVTTKNFFTKAYSINRIFNRSGVIEPSEIVREKLIQVRQFSCLSAQYVTAQPACNSTAACTKDREGEERICVFAALFNGTQLARISVRNLPRPVLYVGNLNELITYVRIDPLVARFSWVPHYWAESVELVPKYLFTLSLALGLLNSVPCYALDGQYIVTTCVNWACKTFSRRHRQQLISIMLTMGTFLLGANIVVGFVKLIL